MMVFADTFALIVWVLSKDAYHPKIVSYLNNYTGKLLTTEWVLVEFADALCSAKQRSTAVTFVEFVRNSKRFEIVGYNETTYQAGFNLFAARPDKDWSLTDCISFAVMTQHKVTDALTADHHFEQAGFRALFA